MQKQGPTKKIKKAKGSQEIRLEIPKSPLRTQQSAQDYVNNIREVRDDDSKKIKLFNDPTGKFRTQKLLQKQKN